MPEELGFPIVVLAVLVFLGWFFLGTQWNVRKGDAVLKWIGQGLPLIGERSTMRWMGSSVMELKIAKAKDPFRTAETLVVFEPRDVFFLWAFARLTRRRDTLIFRAQLRSAPSFEMEIFDPKGWTTRVKGRTLEEKNWKRAELPGDQPFLAYYAGEPNVDAKTLIQLATRAGGEPMRVSVHRAVPNLEIHWRLPKPQSSPARDLCLKLREIGEDVINQKGKS